MATLNPDVILRALAPLPAPEPPEAPREEPPDTVPKRRGLRPAPLERRERAYLSIAEARQMIRDHITAYLDDPMPGRMLLIAAPPGIGKTRFAVETAERWALEIRGRVLYAGPRKEFYADIQALSAQIGLIPPQAFPNWWYFWQGHHDGNGVGLDATCRYAHQMRQWLTRGYTAMAFCQQPRICGWDYINHQCKYHAQRTRREPIIFAQYEHVSLGHPLLEHCNLVIGDELPIRAFLYTTGDQPGWIIPSHAIVPPGMEAGPLETILRALFACTQIPARDATVWCGEPLLNALGGAAHVAAVCEEAQIPLEAIAYAPDVRTPEAVDDVPYFHLAPTINLLKREAEAMLTGRPQIPRIHIDVRGLHLLLRRTPANLPEHVIWLDATANARMYETLFDRPVEIVQPDVELRGRIFQVWASLNNKGQFLPGSHRESKQTENATIKTEHLRQQISQILARGYCASGYIGHKNIIDQLIPVGTPADRVAHFGGSRGTNRLQDCDCLIVIGAPQPTTAAMLDIAAMLYYGRDVAFNPIWSTRDLAFEGQSYAYPMGGFWNDPDLQTLLEQFRDAEIMQAIHRARPLQHQVDIWLLTNVPISGLKVDLVNLHQLFGAVAANGTPLKLREIYRWPAITSWASRTADERESGQLTAPDFARQFEVSAPTARAWMDALIQTGEWRAVSLAGARPGVPGKAICKAFPLKPN